MPLRAFLRQLALSSALFSAALTQASPLLLVNDGILVGANKVEIGSTLYDVRFVSGTCADVFKGCNVTAFTFRNAEEASMAANALLNQVFVDDAQGLFDSKSDLSYNCGSNILNSHEFCRHF